MINRATVPVILASLLLVIAALTVYIDHDKKAKAADMLCADYGIVEAGGDGFIDESGNVSGDLLFGVHAAINMSYASFANTVPGTCLDNGLLIDNKGVQGCTYSVDVVPKDIDLYGHSAWSGSTINTTGSNISLAGGDGTSRYTIVDYTQCTGDTMTLTANGTAYPLVEGINWLATTSNDATCTFLASAMIGTGAVYASCTGAVMYFKRSPGVSSFSVATGDASCATIFNGADGKIEMMSVTELLGGAVLPANISTSPVEPVTCDSSNFGRIELVDDSDDTAGTSICYCGKTDDTTYDWLEMDNTACPFY